LKSGKKRGCEEDSKVAEASKFEEKTRGKKPE